jgi:membrane carboxypeptidase/penicillin-binding protein PbpC
MKFLHTVGITTLWDEKNYGLSLPLGGADIKMLDLAYGFTSLANQGVLAGEDALVPANRVALDYRKTDPVSILEIKDHENTTLYEYSAKGNQVITPATAFIISDMLSDNVARTPAFGAVNPLNLGKGVAVKTGTDSGLKDIVTIGYSPSYVVAVWAGNNDRRKPVSSSGVNGAAPIWNTYMRTLLTSPREEFIKPDNVVGVRWNNTIEYFVVGTKPDKFPPLTSQLTPTSTPALTASVEATINPSWYIFTPYISQVPSKETPTPTPVSGNTTPIPKPSTVPTV